MSWFYFSILSIFALAFAELMQQHLLNLKNAFNERTSAVLTFGFQFILSIPLIFAFGLEDEIFSIFRTSAWQQALFGTFIASFGMVMYLKSFKVKNISFSAILISSSVIISTFLGIIFFSESVTWSKFLGIFLILIAVVVVNFKNAEIEKNHIFGLFAGLIFGVAFTIDKSIMRDIQPLVYIFWSFPLISIWGLIFGYKKVIGSLRRKKFSAYKPIAISGVAYLLYNIATFSAYHVGGEVGRVDAINTAYIFIVILFEYFFLKSKNGVGRKIIATALAVLGIFFLGVA